MDITFTKVEAARAQIRAAIDLWFHEDEIPAQALAYASYEIVHRYCKKKGVHGLVYDTPIVPDKDKRNQINLILKDVPNWIKHAERDEEFVGTKTLNPLVTQVFIMASLIGLMRTGEKLRSYEAAYVYWHWFHNRDWFPPEMSVKGIPPETAEQMRSFPRQQFLRTFLDLWIEGGRYVV
jgi:hypothetical protein